MLEDHSKEQAPEPNSEADVYIKTARFALDLLKSEAFTTPRRQNHYDPKGY